MEAEKATPAGAKATASFNTATAKDTVALPASPNVTTVKKVDIIQETVHAQNKLYQSPTRSSTRSPTARKSSKLMTTMQKAKKKR